MDKLNCGLCSRYDGELVSIKDGIYSHEECFNVWAALMKGVDIVEAQRDVLALFVSMYRRDFSGMSAVLKHMEYPGPTIIEFARIVLVLLDLLEIDPEDYTTSVMQRMNRMENDCGTD